MRRTSRNEYEVVIKHAAAPNAEQRTSAAFVLIFGAADLSPEAVDNVGTTHERKDEKPAIEKTIKKQACSEGKS